MDMASNTSPSEPTQDRASASRQPNLRNPLPLSAAQEAQVKDIYYKRVRGQCAQEIKGTIYFVYLLRSHDSYLSGQYPSPSLTMFPDFAACAVGRTITATWICRNQRLSMNSCMIAHATRAEEDSARAEWFSGREERRKKREEEAAAVERRRGEVIDLIKQEEEKERLSKSK